MGTFVQAFAELGTGKKIMKILLIVALAVAAVVAEPEAEADAAADAWYGYYGYPRYGYKTKWVDGYGYANYGHYVGKREAEADPPFAILMSTVYHMYHLSTLTLLPMPIMYAQIQLVPLYPVPPGLPPDLQSITLLTQPWVFIPLLGPHL